MPVKCVRVSSARHGRCELREVTVTGMRSRTAARFEGSSSSDPVNVSLQMRMSVNDVVFTVNCVLRSDTISEL